MREVHLVEGVGRDRVRPLGPVELARAVARHPAVRVPVLVLRAGGGERVARDKPADARPLAAVAALLLAV